MNITKRLLIIIALIATANALRAQDDRPTFQDYLKSKQQGFNQYKQRKESDFDAFRRQANAQFAAKMAEAWQLFHVEPPIEDPAEPDPINPLVRDKEPVVPTEPVEPSGTVTPVPVTPETSKPDPKPIVPEVHGPNESWFSFSFYNTPCKVHLDNSLKFKLNGVDEQSVAAAWQLLSGDASNALVADCFRLIDDMNLCDWAVIGLFKALGDAWLGRDSNEAVLMQMYLLTQTGYRVRIGRIENRLVLLVSFDGKVYGMSYYKLDGEAYYNIKGEKGENKCYLFKEAFPGEKQVSLKPAIPVLAEDFVETRSFCTDFYPEMAVKVKVNRNLMSFMEGYPHCRHDNYVYSNLSESVKQAVYPVFRKAIEGKPMNEAADMLLNFMHMAFKYKSDKQQFGYERPFFGDESFWFPFNDCEDRAILYCILVRDLLGIDAYLLEFPKHMSTAIALPMEVKGSYLNIDGKRFLMCDPTFIGSHIGEVPDELKNINPKVIIIK